METTRLSTKGQIILPKAVRESRHWRAGTEFSVEPVEGGVILRPLRPFPPKAVEEVMGCLKYKGKRKSVREMDQSISRGIRERHARGRY